MLYLFVFGVGFVCGMYKDKLIEKVKEFYTVLKAKIK